MDTSELSLDKFGSIGGDYFEILIAVALDELGYEEGKTYIPSWHKKCVPGTWIEADFIIGDKKSKNADPLNHPQFVFAIGHATSEDSARMKFHRDVEQLIEVKALENGDDIMVVDILFCCPRETMGGWSQDLISINEAIFDDSLTVWKYDWGIRLLKCIQDSADQLGAGPNEAAKKKNIKKLLERDRTLRKHFNSLKKHVKKILSNRKSKSKIPEMFAYERAALPKRLKMPLLITSKEKTEYKRGLIQALALNDWELKLLYQNHQEWLDGGTRSLEELALESGMSQEEFNNWWQRLDLLSVKIGTCEKKLNEYEDNILSEDTDEYCFFKASNELGYVFQKFELEVLLGLYSKVKKLAPNLNSYIIDLRNLSRPKKALQILLSNINSNDFTKICQECFTKTVWRSLKVPRLLPFEVAKAAIEVLNKEYSYDTIANESGNEALIKNPFTMRFIAGKKGNIHTEAVTMGLNSLGEKFAGIYSGNKNPKTDEVVTRFIYNRFDGMVKQPKGSVLDALLYNQIKVFAKDINARLTQATIQGVPSFLNKFVHSENAGVNVEIPYILVLKDKRRIFIHRVMSDGGMGHKRKEFSSKIRTIRYTHTKAGIIPRKNYFCSILIVDGNWITPKFEDPFMPIRMLTVAGWDYVVYPDGLPLAFAEIQKRLDAERKPQEIHIPEEEPLPLAAENKEPILISDKRKKVVKKSANKKKMRKRK